MTKIALYLAGGGARGAYQAGVLKAISTILATKEIPFDMLTGASVGSINAGVLAENALDFTAGANKLDELWRNITCDHIFKASNYALGMSAMRNMSNMLLKQRLLGHILDTSPLQKFINNIINFEVLEHSIKNKHLEMMEVISSCYETQQTISFYQHHAEDFEDWNDPLHSSQRVNLRMEYFLASTSLPLFFPPARIDGYHYGDGHVGLAAPLRGAIRCQMDKILIIGTRSLPDAKSLGKKIQENEIDFTRVLGNMVNGLFLDNLERDLELVNHMNSMAQMLPTEKKAHSPWRPIQTLHLRPSVDIASLAQSHYNNMPMLLRILLNFLGAKRHSGDLLSFLLFEKKFTCELIKLGYEDTMAAHDSILNFFEA
ncbi:patatin-like phospholipase family protein [Fluoribacter dumoffii]|uniref:Patatin n=1 Tax=Fluoribacter dumoffii TaxID=463 RepID=A0A377G6E3_9GAMM|nr:patatin-like phospholipase family protein [Fluoribacter dumoffii]KTC92383.1 alpha-beta hydrolase family transporter esterase [Fluoribacter dumoffii NY 23]MCW8386961.1 patatin-like phospholipase family protein [Fluoribacter dumoffii]MCW8417536.1 patatin-like phospholipase family protein [Fluoribacter dumoffii]MCW8454622.1 patatin-like phospholipase family protein [Fluoribacter dumoffii]MCW8461301.1 patatin-like phospholipase family protein [Fluoribacter dumoffii]